MTFGTKACKKLSFARLVVVLLMAPASTGAQSTTQQSPTRWLSIHFGGDVAGITTVEDTVFEGSLGVLAGAGVTWPVRRRYALAAHVVGSRAISSADCYGGVCPPPFNLAGATIAALSCRCENIAPQRTTFGLGIGFFRVLASESKKVAPRTTYGYEALIDRPVLRTRRTSFTIGLRGLLLPELYDQTAWILGVTSGLRFW
jgi:hypothetical protein